MAVPLSKVAADLIKSIDAPVVCFKFGAKWCGPCKTVEPLFNELSQNAKGVNSYAIDVEESEDVAVAFNVKALPTFIFATAKLTADGSAEIIETIVGPQEEALRVNFAKASQAASGYLNRIAPQAPMVQQPQQYAQQVPQAPMVQQPQQYAQQGPPQLQAPLAQQQYQQGQIGQQQPQQYAQHLGPNQVVKKELAEIRALLVQAIQRTERLYNSLQ